jgi:signal transduction histidine kinase
VEDEGLTMGSDAAHDGARARDRWEWIRPTLRWASVILPIACAIVAATDWDNTLTGRLLGFVLAVAYGGWILLLDRKVCQAHDAGTVLWPIVSLAGSLLIFGALVVINPAFFFVAFLLYWQIFSTLPLLPAIVVAIVFSAEMLALQLHYSRHSLLDDPSMAVSGVISIAFGIFMAVWIGGIIEQSGQRADLIRELEATRADLAAAHHEAGVQVERERLRQEIHDTLAQGFTSIVMLAQATEGALDNDDGAQVRRHVESIERTARENLAEARSLVEGTRPAPLDGSSLPDALRRLTERLGADLGIRATATVTGTTADLPPATEVAVLRAAQEALTNVRRHAGATAVSLTFLRSDEGVMLEVTDDGRGFDVASAGDDPAHVGLRGMRARLEEVGGDVLVESEPGRGTTVIVTMP